MILYTIQTPEVIDIINNTIQATFFTLNKNDIISCKKFIGKLKH